MDDLVSPWAFNIKQFLPQLLRIRRRFVAIGLGIAVVGSLLILDLANGPSAFAGTLRIASINLCADQLLMTLADRQQVTSLGPFAKNRSLSYMAAQAESYPANRGSAEEIIRQRANLVFAGPFDSRLSRQILQRQGVEIFMLDEWQSVEQGFRQITAVAAKIGHEARGHALIAEIHAALHMLDTVASTQSRPKEVLILQKRGYAVNRGVLVELVQRAGMVMQAGSPRTGVGTLLRLESITAQPADILIATGRSANPEDQGEALLVHPALLRLFPVSRQVHLPEQLISCAGPSTPELLRVFAAGLKRVLLAAPVRSH